MASYQWYPGHMTKARRSMQEDIKLVDLIIEIVDARAPLSTRNPDIDSMGNGKLRMIVLNKADLASKAGNDVWSDYFEKKGIRTVMTDSKSGSGVKQLKTMINEVCAKKKERDRARGIKNRPVRAMVAGIPNVGKSTFINAIAGRGVTKTGNRPGVTKGKQWISIGRDVELLDTPGILWPKIEDEDAAFRMALIGSMNDEVINGDELIAGMIDILKKEYPDTIYTKYGTSSDDDIAAFLEKAAVKLNALSRGGGPDTERAASIMLDDFRSGRLGRATLEFPEK